MADRYRLRGKKSVVDALTEAVGVNRFAEIVVRVGVVLTAWRGSHPELGCWLKILEYLSPVAVFAGAAAVTFINNDDIEKVAGELPWRLFPATRQRAGESALGRGRVQDGVHPQPCGAKKKDSRCRKSFSIMK
jgi:hypothetical protein